MAADKQRRISGKKKGAGHREIFALFEKGHWVVEDELDRLVSEKMRSFGHQSPAHCEWGQGASTVPPHLKSSFEPPSFHEFVQALRKVRKRRAVCENDIPAYAILQGNEWLQHFCFDVIVWVWNRPDKAPKRWWGDNIRFIPKERGDQSQLQGWRPIAVGGTIYGILMRLWAARLRKVAEQCNWLADEQCGFRPRRSARGAAALLRSHWYQLEGNGCIVQGDIEKAFPSISPANLSKLLADRGVPMHFLALLDAVYTGVRVDGFVSGKLRGASGHCSWETQGLRQGCPASPLLMAIWINQAFSELKEKGFSVVGYADDIWVVCASIRADEARNSLAEVFLKAGLTVNKDKLKVWNPSMQEPFCMLGMPILTGRKTSVSDLLRSKLEGVLALGRSRKYQCHQRVQFVNTVVAPSLRFWAGGCSVKENFKFLEQADCLVREFVRKKRHDGKIDWPTSTPTGFMEDTHVGLGLLSLAKEIVRDLCCFMWALGSGAESLVVRSAVSEDWKRVLERRSPRIHPLLDDWLWVVDNVCNAKTAVELKEESCTSTPSVVFPFGPMKEGVLKKSGSLPCPPTDDHSRCGNIDCQTQPCARLVAARERAAEIVWILEKTMQAGRNEPPRRCGAMLLERRSDCEIVCFPCLNLLQTTRKAIEVMRTKGTKDIFILLKAETSSGMESLCADCSSWGITVDVHEVRANASCWGFQMMTSICNNILLRQKRPKSLSSVCPRGLVFGQEQCGNLSCVGTCLLLVKAREAGDHVIWTDGSYSPEVGRASAAFGVESNGYLNIQAFQIRGSAARAEGAAILAAITEVVLKNEGNALILSDCKSQCDEVSRIVAQISQLSRGSYLCDEKSEGGTNNRFSVSSLIRGAVSKLSSQGRRVTLHWVKAHCGISQNEAVDSAAKKVLSRKSFLPDETASCWGELVRDGKLIERRQEILVEEWKPHWQKDAMRNVRSGMAKRVICGIEQWEGLAPHWLAGEKLRCCFCSKRHETTFEGTIRVCAKWAGLRKEIMDLWLEKDLWNDELLFGRITRKTFAQCVSLWNQKDAYSIIRRRLNQWESLLKAFRAKLDSIKS